MIISMMLFLGQMSLSFTPTIVSMSRLKTLFQYSLKRYPVPTNISVYGSFYLFADLSQQTFNHHYLPEKPEINYFASVRVACVGALLFAPILYHWYRYLDRIMPGNKTKFVIRKVAMDQGIMTPILISAFYIVNSIVEQRADIFDEVRHKFWKTFLYNQCFWIPGQTINFSFIPPHMRVVYVASVSFVWINVLCLIKREQVNKVESKAKD